MIIRLLQSVPQSPAADWYVASNSWECKTDVRHTISSPNGKKSLVVLVGTAEAPPGAPDYAD